MVETYIMNILAEILSSKIRSEIFRLLFGVNGGSLHMREIERRSGLTIGTIQQELKKIGPFESDQREKRWKPSIL